MYFSCFAGNVKSNEIRFDDLKSYTFEYYLKICFYNSMGYGVRLD
jgi:hypothetical protein